jgi:2-methylcitrate dehydratase PrpD
LKLIKRHSIPPDALARIDIAVPSANATLVNRPATPTARAATLGSAQYVMAVTALRGKMDLQSFEDKFLRDPKVHSLMAKVTVSGSAELDRHFPKYWSGRVTVELHGGKGYSEQILAPKGEKENPMTSAEVEEKFVALAAPVIGNKAAQKAIQITRSLETNRSSVELLTALGTADPLPGKG